MLAGHPLCGLVESLDVGVEVPFLGVGPLAGWGVRAVVDRPGVGMDHLVGQEVCLPGELLAADVARQRPLVGRGHVSAQLGELGELFVAVLATERQ